MRELTDHEQNLLSTDQWRPLAFLRGEMLEVTHAELRRWEAHALAVEDQRDKALTHNEALTRRIGELEAVAYALMERVDGKLAAAIAERNEARNQLNDLQAGMRQWEDGHASAVASVIAERDAARVELAQLKSDLLAGGWYA